MSKLLYRKQTGAAVIAGHLYETKLTSLLLLRALHDDEIEEFYIGTNVEGLGDFDDICFRFKVKGSDKPYAVFLQARHISDQDTAPAVTIIDLTRYFESYMKIRNEFKVNSKDAIFKDAYEDVECAFVFYTNRKDALNKKYEKTTFICKVNDSIRTGDDAFRISFVDEDVKRLHTFLQTDDITKLAAILAKLLRNKHYNHEHLMSEQLIQTYHVVVAQHVLNITDVKPEGHRLGSFKTDFFHTNDENLLLLKDILFSEIIKDNKPNENEIPDLLSQLLSESSEATISPLIGGVIAYKNNKLTFVHKRLSVDQKLARQLEEVNVTEAVVKSAIDARARSMVQLARFKLPPQFGNKDLTIRGDDKNIERRLHHLAVNIIKLLMISEERYINDEKYNIVDIDDSFTEKGFVQINGGIGGAVGNLLVMDETTKLLMLSNREDLKDHSLALRLFDEIISKIGDKGDLKKYRFDVKFKHFPKLSFGCTEYDKRLVEDFMNKILCFTNQGAESEVENKLKEEIAKLLNIKEQCNFRIKTEAIYLKYYDNIVQWSMNEQGAMYLTKETDLFKSSTEYIWPILTITNIFNRYRFIKSNIEFNTEAVNTLNFNASRSKVTLIITEFIDLSVIKVAQHFKDTEYIIIDLNYILNLPTNDYTQFIVEMASNSDKIFILVWNRRLSALGSRRNTKDLLQTFNDKILVVVTNHKTVDETKTCFLHAVIDSKMDTKISLADLTKTSQEIILYRDVLFQGVKVKLNKLLDDDSMVLIHGEHLVKLINEESILIGGRLTNPDYEEIKEFYITRKVTKKVQFSKPPIKSRSADNLPELKCERKRFSEKTITTISVENLDDSSFQPVENLADFYFRATPRSPSFDSIRPDTLYDIQDRAVLLTAEPGMGKSSLLTHLSLKTKARNPGVWIVRINLLDYSRYFHQWKENKLVIDILEALRFVCVAVINQIENGFMSSEKIILKEKKGGICLSYCTELNDAIIFELSMFLYFCNRRKVIFLFDGFDEICPHYMTEVITFIGVLKNYRPSEHRVWVTSRTYNDVLDNLVQEFGVYYQLNAFDTDERRDMFQATTKFIGTKSMLLYYIKRAVYDIFSTPLLLLLVDFNNKFKGTKISHWEFIIGMDVEHEYFMETILKKKYFEDKNKMDVNIPFIQIIYERTRQELVNKYKKLAAYGTFNKFVDKLFNETEIRDVKNTMNSIKLGEDKTGIICDIRNGVPRFVDDTIFGDYFAVEHICDLLKAERSDDELYMLWDFILNIIFIEIKQSVLHVFDKKLKKYENVLTIVRNERHKRTIFKLLMKENSKFSLRLAMSSKLSNWMKLFISTFEFINSQNLRDFIGLIVKNELLRYSIIKPHYIFINAVINTIRNIDQSQLQALSTNVPGSVDWDGSNKKIIRDLKISYSTYGTLALHSHAHSDTDSDSDSISLRSQHKPGVSKQIPKDEAKKKETQ